MDNYDSAYSNLAIESCLLIIMMIFKNEIVVKTKKINTGHYYI